MRHFNRELRAMEGEVRKLKNTMSIWWDLHRREAVIRLNPRKSHWKWAITIRVWLALKILSPYIVRRTEPAESKEISNYFERVEADE